MNPRPIVPQRSRPVRRQLVHWSEVQVTDPELAPLATYRVQASIKTEDGSRFQPLRVRAPQGLTFDQLTPFVAEHARALGFTFVGLFRGVA